MKELRVTRSAPRWAAPLLGAALVAVLAPCVQAHVVDKDIDGTYAPKDPGANAGPTRGGHYSPQAVPEINGPGRVSTVGNVWLKTTNIGVMGNPFTANSSDPSAQWPGPSGNEFLFYWGLWVGAKNPEATDPALVRRVSQNTEWRPPTPAPEDRIYQSYDG